MAYFHSMPPARHFIGWDEPPTTRLCEFLLEEVGQHSGAACGRQAAGSETCATTPGTGPIDFSDTLVVAPTRQAGRSLRERLALVCAEKDSTVLSLQVVPPAFFLHPEQGFTGVADEITIKAVWARVMLKADHRRYPAFLPTQPPGRDFTWAMQIGEMLQALRGDLCEVGLQIGDAVKRYAQLLDEQDRWQDMARLERSYLRRLSSLGLQDPFALRVGYAHNPVLPSGIHRIVLACVPDPPPLVTAALEALPSSIQIDTLVCAPNELADCFDTWGRPLPAEWEDLSIPIPDPVADLSLAGSPQGQCRIVLSEIATDADHPGAADIAIGVPDRSVIPFLTSALEAHGISAFDPTDKLLSDHSLYHLLNAACDILCERSYTSFAAVLRHPDMLASLDVPAADLLRELDEFQNRFLPLTIDTVAALTAEAEEYRNLARAVAVVTDLLRPFDQEAFPAAMRKLLQRIYESRMLSSDDSRDVEFGQASRLVDDALREFETGAADELDLTSQDAARLFLSRLDELQYHREREQSGIDLLGWLELPWTDARHLYVTGMNEGFVPDSRVGDSFLPDSLRRHLGMRCDASRLARDAFLMRICIESRRQHGRTCFVVGKTSVTGDPLKPSRLLFRCDDEALPSRTARLFGAAPEPRPTHATSVSFRLTPCPIPGVKQADLTPESLSVTTFRVYLDCPFRFYLQNILGMSELDDRKREMDALDFGVMVHDALQSMGRDPAMAACDDEPALAAFLAGRAERWIHRRFGSRLSVPVLVALDSAQQRLRAVARRQVELVAGGWEIISCEQKYEMVVGGMKVRGKIDRVDRHRETGRIRLMDYKTSDSASEPEKVHLGSARSETPDYACFADGKRTHRWVDLQLPLYHHLYVAEHGADSAPAELAYFNIPKAVTHTGVSAWKKCTEKMLSSSLACAEAVARHVRNHDYWPPASSVTYDSFERLACGWPLEEVFEPMDSPGNQEDGP